MKRIPFNSGWTGGLAETAFAEMKSERPTDLLTLPHDGIRDLPREPGLPDGGNNGYFPGGYFRYSKTFELPERHRDGVVLLEFEGVYRDAVVFVNGDFAAQWRYGYSRFVVDLSPYLLGGQEVTVDVECRAHRDSRWYSGVGIHRDVFLVVGDDVHLELNGVRVTTPEVDRGAAMVVVETAVVNEQRRTRTLRAEVEIHELGGELVARGTSPITLLPRSTERAAFRLLVADPRRWNVDTPDLYETRVVLRDESGTIVDSDEVRFGIRSLSVDPVRGLRLNGEEVKLRGACIHHDNGLLGAAAIARAEERRIEILKTAGFNAIRSSHNPLSVAMLDACDRLGMLVMDETFDVWTQPKTAFDYSTDFPEWWERDVESMVTKDFNHPSVVMYSIGNEIFEVGSPVGSTWGRRLADTVRSLDPTRFVTNGINGLVAMSGDVPDVLTDTADGPTDVNAMITELNDQMNELGASEEVSARTEESHAVLDVSGLNYCDSRYVPDRVAYPNRVIVGTETFPGHIDELWRLVTDNSHVIGDFTWTGWDYLGEVGVGRTDYPDEGYERTGFLAPFPALTAAVADIDITGFRRPISYYRETVYGLRSVPYIAVHRPEHHGKPLVQTPWSWADAVSSWSWDVAAGSLATVDVYSSGDEIELLLNGAVVARTAVGAVKPFIARFDVEYRPGELVAVAYRDGTETGRTLLLTADDAIRLAVEADRAAIRANACDLAYVPIELRAENGVLASHRDRAITVGIDGPGVLAGLGSGRPVTTERFGADTCTTFDGRALAIVRPVGPGEIRITVAADGCDDVTAVVLAS